MGFPNKLRRFRLPSALSTALGLMAASGSTFAQETRHEANPENVTKLDLVTVVGVTPLTGTDIDPRKLPYYVGVNQRRRDQSRAGT